MWSSARNSAPYRGLLLIQIFGFRPIPLNRHFYGRLSRGVVINYPTRSRLPLSIQNTAPSTSLCIGSHHKTSLDVRASQTNREEISHARNMPTRSPKIAIMRPHTLEWMNIAPERPSHGDDASYERRATYPTPRHSIETQCPFSMYVKWSSTA